MKRCCHCHVNDENHYHYHYYYHYLLDCFVFSLGERIVIVVEDLILLWKRFWLDH